MAEFSDAVEFVLAAEGDMFTNDPADSGGATRYGISLRFLREIPPERLKRYGIFGEPTLADVEYLTRPQAILIYEWEFWVQAPFDLINHQPLCNYVFDLCVLHGMGQGIRILQRATWAVTGVHEWLDDDGIMGSKTVIGVNAILANHHVRDILVAAIMAERAGFCRMLAEQRPKDGKYLHGWLKRCYKI
jgi:lysozyme family protein